MRTSRGTATAWALGLGCALILLTTSQTSAAQSDPWWGKDKAWHVSISVGLGAVGYAVLRGCDSSPTTSWIGATSTAVTVGAGKEMADAAGMGQPSWKDFTWDVVGSLIGATVAWGIDELTARRATHEEEGNRRREYGLTVQRAGGVIVLGF